MPYFVIYQGEDDLTIEQLNEAELVERLNDDWYADDFLQKIKSSNMQEWNIGDVLIIKGEIVVPKPVQVVKEWKL